MPFLCHWGCSSSDSQPKLPSWAQREPGPRPTKWGKRCEARSVPCSDIKTPDITTCCGHRELSHYAVVYSFMIIFIYAYIWIYLNICVEVLQTHGNLMALTIFSISWNPKAQTPRGKGLYIFCPAGGWMICWMFNMEAKFTFLKLLKFVCWSLTFL